nr:DUF6241 domain-containing protein [Neobacillus sp. Marseille-Q6967]
MSHQKVFAHQKWGSSEITREKVVKLFEVIQGTTFEQESTKKMLLSVLEPWTTGDFSNAVAGHNSIWNQQGGTVGEAIRLLTPKEELIYIEENFR